MLNELPGLPVRSIASLDCDLLPNEQPPTVTYNGVTGYLLRRRCDDERELLALTMSEFNECLAASAPADTASI